MGKQYYDDYLEGYLVLQDMHDTIINGETFSQDLIARADNVIDELGSWRLPDKKIQNIRADIVITILDQLELNEKLEKKKEELLKNYMQAVISPSTIDVTFTAEIQRDGRIQIPGNIRRAKGLDRGDVLEIRINKKI